MQPSQRSTKEGKGEHMLLIIAIVLLVIAIAGGVIIHPLLFLLALVALAMFFSGSSPGHRASCG
jgi:hypothetical protein